MLRYRVAAILAAVTVIALPLALGACGGDDEAEAKPAVHTDFDAQNFSDSTKIDNEYSPLDAGHAVRLRGPLQPRPGPPSASGDLHRHGPGRRRSTACARSCCGTGTSTRASCSRASWRCGPRTTTATSGCWASTRRSTTSTAGSRQAPDTWLAGVDRAQAGIMMRADPKAGTSRYRQGLAPTIGFADVAKVEKTGQQDCVPTGCYDDVAGDRGRPTPRSRTTAFS